MSIPSITHVFRWRGLHTLTPTVRDNTLLNVFFSAVQTNQAFSKG